MIVIVVSSAVAVVLVVLVVAPVMCCLLRWLLTTNKYQTYCLQVSLWLTALATEVVTCIASVQTCLL